MLQLHQVVVVLECNRVGEDPAFFGHIYPQDRQLGGRGTDTYRPSGLYTTTQVQPRLTQTAQH